MHGFEILIFVVVIALIALGAYFAHQQQVRRREELARLAASRDWSFDSAKDHSHDERYADFGIFTQGGSRYAYNTLRGGVEIANALWSVQLGDYHYTTTSSNGKTTTTHTHLFSYAVIESPYVGAPDLAIRAEGFFDKFAGMLGFDDIDFESEEFSRRFHVRSADKRFAYDVLHPQMMEFMLDGSPPAIEIRRGRCCLSRGAGCWAVEQFGETVDWARKFFERWPRHLTGVLEAQIKQS